MVGIDPESDFTIGPWLKDNLGRPLAGDEIILGANAHIFLGKSESKVGDEEYFYGKKYTVAGILESTGIGIDDAGFLTMDSVYDMAKISDKSAVMKLDVKPGDVSAFMVDVKPDATRSEVARRIEVEVPGVAVVTSKELMSSSVASQLDTLMPWLRLIGIVFWVIVVLMIGALFSTIVNERRREIGLLQAVGATRRFIFRLVMLEAMQLTVIGGIVGLAVGAVAILLLKGVVTSSVGIAYLWPGSGYVVVFVAGYLVMSIITGILAALYPAIVASRLEPYQAIRTGE